MQPDNESQTKHNICPRCNNVALITESFMNPFELEGYCDYCEKTFVIHNSSFTSLKLENGQENIKEVIGKPLGMFFNEYWEGTLKVRGKKKGLHGLEKEERVYPIPLKGKDNVRRPLKKCMLERDNLAFRDELEEEIGFKEAQYHITKEKFKGCTPRRFRYTHELLSITETDYEFFPIEKLIRMIKKWHGEFETLEYYPSGKLKGGSALFTIKDKDRTVGAFVKTGRMDGEHGVFIAPVIDGSVILHIPSKLKGVGESYSETLHSREVKEKLEDSIHNAFYYCHKALDEMEKQSLSFTSSQVERVIIWLTEEGVISEKRADELVRLNDYLQYEESPVNRLYTLFKRMGNGYINSYRIRTKMRYLAGISALYGEQLVREAME